MALYPTLFGHVDLPCPEPLRRPDRQGAQEIGVRLVRRGGSTPNAVPRVPRSEA